MKLHIGGTEPKPDWKILNIQPGKHVDFLGSCDDLSLFDDSSLLEIYASHVFEHLSHRDHLKAVLGECCRILKPGGLLKLSVPNLVVLSRLFSAENVTVQQRYELMLMMFGGHIDEFDMHKVGCWDEFMALHLLNAGFKKSEKVEEFGLFEDSSSTRLFGELISLNMIATK